MALQDKEHGLDCSSLTASDIHLLIVKFLYFDVLIIQYAKEAATIGLFEIVEWQHS